MDSRSQRPRHPLAWRDAVSLSVALSLSAAIVLGAWKDEYRPAVLDVPADVASAGLRYLGVYPGLAVFNSEYQRPGRTRVLRAACLEVLGSTAAGPPARVYPARACPPTGIRMRVTPEEIFLARLMMWATEDEARRRMEPTAAPGTGEVTVAGALLPVVGYYFDRRERHRGTPRDALWIRFTHYDMDTWTGELFEIPVVVFHVTVHGGPIQVAWFPSPQQVAELWPAGVPPA